MIKVDNLVDDEVRSIIASLSLYCEPQLHLWMSASEVARSAAERALYKWKFKSGPPRFELVPPPLDNARNFYQLSISQFEIIAV